MSTSTTYRDVERAIKYCKDFNHTTSYGVAGYNTDGQFEYVIYAEGVLMLVLTDGRVSYFNDRYYGRVQEVLQAIICKYHDVSVLELAR